MHNRDRIKWAPFNSVINGKDVIEKIKEEKVMPKPTLSDEQIETLEQKIKECYDNKTIIDVTFYKNGKFIKIDGIITKIDIVGKKIILNHRYSLYFSNIMQIIEKNT